MAKLEFATATELLNYVQAKVFEANEAGNERLARAWIKKLTPKVYAAARAEQTWHIK